MVVTVALRDRPGEVLYSFSKVGDSVCIGRDKRQCKITLGINAQGVSRVHLKLELLPNGRLLARDTSTYGTGYDGGPFVIEREKELKPSVVLQVGSSFFIVEEKNVKETCLEETHASLFLRTGKTDSRKRLASNKATVVLEEECVTEKRKVMDNIMEKLAPRMSNSESEVARTIEMRNGLVANTNSILNRDEPWIQIQDRKLVSKLGKKAKEEMDSIKLAYYRRIADFLPSDDDDNEESERNRSEVSMLTVADSFRNVDSTKNVSLHYDSSNKNIRGVVQDIYFPTADIPVFSKNAQLTSFLSKSVNELSNIRKNYIPISHNGQLNLLESHNVNEKFCDSSKKVLKEKDPSPLKVNKEETFATELASWLGMNTVRKRSCQFNNFSEKKNESSTDEVLVATKRIKLEVIEDDNKREKLEKNESTFGTRIHCYENVGGNDQIFEMNMEVLHMKLKKAVQYENLDRPILAKDKSQSYLTSHWQRLNCKRFRKAAQGSHGGCGLPHSAITRIEKIDEEAKGIFKAVLRLWPKILPAISDLYLHSNKAEHYLIMISLMMSAIKLNIIASFLYDAAVGLLELIL
uniref:Bm573, isoform a n=1 Tax=Brugia malayi TaxID=6279 RepID=A0A0J9XY35_BRUMA|nr:Bm573, isoform a [Brugia malayi]